MKSSYLFPFYRVVTSKYNFDDYASKGSTVYPVRKYHRNMHALQGAAPPYQQPAIGQGRFYVGLSYDVGSGSEIAPCNKIDKPLAV